MAIQSNDILLSIKTKFEGTGSKQAKAATEDLAKSQGKLGDAAKKTAKDLGLETAELQELRRKAIEAKGAMQGLGSTDFGRLIAGSRQASMAMQNIRSAILGGIAGALASLAGVGFGGAFQKGIEGAQRFEKAMASVKLLTSATAAEVAKFRSIVGSMSRDTMTSTGDLAEGFFAVQSAGIQGAAALELTASAAAASALGLGSVTDIVRAASTAFAVFSADGLTTEEAVTGIAAAAKIGNFEVSELAGSMNRVLPAAKAAGANFNDVSANIANMSIYTGSATQSVENLNALFVRFNQYSPQTNKLLEAAGTNLDEIKKNIADNGLLSAMDDLKKKLANTFKGGELDTAIAAIFQDQNAISAFRNLADNAEANAARIVGYQTAIKTSTTEMQAEFKKTPAGELAAAQADLNSKIGELGRDLLPPLVTVLKSVVENFDLLKAAAVGAGAALLVGGLVAGIGTMISLLPSVIALIRAWTGAQWTLNIAMDANPIGAIIALIGILATAWTYLYGKYAVVAEGTKYLGEVFRSLWDILRAVADLIIDFQKGINTGDWSFSHIREGMARLAADSDKGAISLKRFWLAAQGKDPETGEVLVRGGQETSGADYTKSLGTSLADRQSALESAFGYMRNPQGPVTKPPTTRGGGGLSVSGVLGGAGGSGGATRKTQAERDYESAIKKSQEFVKQLNEETKGIGENAFQKKENAAQTLIATMKIGGLTKAESELVTQINASTAAYKAAFIADRIATENTAYTDQIALLRLQISLIGASAREQAIATAGMKADQEARKDKTLSADEIAARVAHAKEIAGLTEDLKLKNDAYNDSLSITSDRMARIAESVSQLTQNLGQGLGEGIERMGAALGGLLTTFSSYAAEKAKLDQDEAAAKKNASPDRQHEIELEYIDKRKKAEVGANVAALSAAKSFFKEKSTAYKVLSGLETAYRAVELAGHVKSMAMDAIATAKSIGNALLKGAAHAGAAAANIMGQLGVFGFPVVAAMLGMLAGLGVAVSGGKGNGGINYSVEDLQESAGTGSVLGDPTGKSNSISKALEAVARNTNKSLEFENAQLKALRSIDSSIGAVATALARSLGVGGALDTTDLGLGTTSKGATGIGKFNPFSWLLPGLFGSTTTKTLADQGLNFSGQNLNDLISQGIAGSTYQTVTTNTKKKFFGITTSNKTNTDTTNSAIDGDLQNQITLLIANLKTGVLAAAGILGATGAEGALAAFTVELGKISLKDMSNSEIAEALNAVFSKLGDQMAETGVPGIEAFQKAGEGLFETLQRLAKDYQVVDVTLKSIGMSFKTVGLGSVEARERLVELAGGLDALTESASSFSDTYLTKEEQIGPVMKAVSDEMTRLGLGAIKTKEDFKRLVLGLDVSTESGAELYTALMAVAPAFATVQDYLAELNGTSSDVASAIDAVKDARSALTAAYSKEASALQETINTFTSLVKSLKTYGQSLLTGPAAMLSPEEAYRAAKARFEDNRARVASGDSEAAKDTQAVSQDFLEASKNYYASSEGYFLDLEKVKTAVQAAENLAKRQVDVAEQQLEQLKTMVKTLIKIDESVLSVKDAVDGLNTAMSTALAAAGGKSSSSGSSSLPSWFSASKYGADNPDLAANFAAGGIMSQLGATLDEALAAHYLRTGAAEIASGGRKYATGAAFRNGIATRPTGFSEATMGEAGPEGILPLANIGGKLGVYSAGADNSKAILDELKKANVQRGAGDVALIAEMAAMRSEFEQLKREIARK